MVEPKPLVLVIDDERQIRRLLKVGLESHGFEVVEAETGREGLEAALSDKLDVIILDLGLPDLSGLEVLKKLRTWSSVPVIILSVQSDEEDKIEALDGGANDYVTKPFGMGELLARIRAARRLKVPVNIETLITLGPLEINLVNRTVKKGDEFIHLTHTEYDLLALFLKNSGKVLTHRQVLREVWGPNQEQDTHYLRIYVGSLRKKIEPDPSNPTLILTEPGVGYRFKQLDG